MANDDWELISRRIFELVALEPWNELTQSSLATYLTLRGAKYLFPDKLDHKNRLTLAIMINDEIRLITVP